MSARIWRPYTQMKTASPPLPVKSAKGVYLELEDGRRLMDCISSWWVTVHGHGNTAIANAIFEQAQKLEQVIFADFTHQPAEDLAEKLVSQLPPSLEKVFYSDNGSTAVEVAIKMAVQYWKNKGEKRRNRLICFEGAYHGDTFGAMSIGERSQFTHPFNEFLFDVTFLPFPETFWGDDEVERKESETLQRLENLLQDSAEEYAGIILEPLVQGAGGMRMCRVEFLQQLEKVVRKYGILLIYDEVMTGFGRTGDWFACRKSNTTPDIICLSKGISGGFLPLAVTVTSKDIYEAFYDDDNSKTLYHGHSYTANPIACAAAKASLELLEASPDIFMKMEGLHSNLLKGLQPLRKVRKMRVCGTISALEIETGEKGGYLNKVGPFLKKEFLERGFLLRPLGNVLYLLPPYCITEEELKKVYQCMGEVLDRL